MMRPPYLVKVQEITVLSCVLFFALRILKYAFSPSRTEINLKLIPVEFSRELAVCTVFVIRYTCNTANKLSNYEISILYWNQVKSNLGVRCRCTVLIINYSERDNFTAVVTSSPELKPASLRILREKYL